VRMEDRREEEHVEGRKVQEEKRRKGRKFED
jgi:ribosomal protein L34